MESPFKPDILKGKVALLTGGGSGIGFEISTQFGKHGASMAIMGRRKSVLDSAVASLRSLGILAVGFEGDVRKQEDAKTYVNGTTVVVDGGLWLSRPRHLPKDAVKQLSRALEKRSRATPVGLPKSKL